jgi:EAL domain-containing protein (putative c-di-GMP-specific phosphodiesterase class I)
VVSLGHALNLSVVAEGVETAEEAAHVAALGCDLGQGYYFALPLPRDQASALIIQERHTAAALPDRTGSRTAQGAPYTR